jgi:Ca2+-binding RTX toxin-like protein
VAAQGGAELYSSSSRTDELIGGRGRDAFRFEADLATDKILDFDPFEDRIELVSASYAGLGPLGALSEEVFATSRHEMDSNDRILLESGYQLYYDRDGSGPASAVLIVYIDFERNHHDFSLSNIFLI